jgi:hypothetical protein
VINRTVVVFGWVVRFAKLDAGEIFRAVYRRDRTCETAPNWTLWTRGGYETLSRPDGLQTPPRPTGFVSKRDAPDTPLPRGEYVLRATADAEYCCVSKSASVQQPAEPESIFIPAGESYTATKGELLMIAFGETDVGGVQKALAVESESAQITAITDTWLVKFDRRAA